MARDSLLLMGVWCNINWQFKNITAEEGPPIQTNSSQARRVWSPALLAIPLDEMGTYYRTLSKNSCATNCTQTHLQCETTRSQLRCALSYNLVFRPPTVTHYLNISEKSCCCVYKLYHGCSIKLTRLALWEAQKWEARYRFGHHRGWALTTQRHMNN